MCEAGAIERLPANGWAESDGDIYINVAVDERLQTMTGRSNCRQSVRGVRQRAAAMTKHA
jgi:hypothetical protein